MKHSARKTDSQAWEELGRYIKNRRVAQGISQLALAKKLGFSSQFLGRIESGKVPLPDMVFSKLVRELKLEKTKVSRIFIQGTHAYITQIFGRSSRRT